jgi:hypothetical protein
VAGPEPSDGHVVGELVAGKHPEGEVFGQPSFDLPGGVHPYAIRIQEHAEEQLRVAVPVAAVRLVEGREVELVDHVEDEPGGVVFRQPVPQVRREQEGLVAVAA